MLSPLAFRCAALLRHLANHPADGPRAIERSAGIPKANVSRDLRLLAAEGLIVEGPPHALTADGREALTALSRLESPAEPAEITGIRHARLAPDPLNPRKSFDDEEIDGLAWTILSAGAVLQNLLVRPAAPGGPADYRIVAGERRWRAVGRLIERGEWPAAKPLPCRIVEIDDAMHEKLAVIENAAREGLKPLEEARAFERLRDAHGLPTEQIAQEIGRSLRYVQLRLQLLKLPPIKQLELESGAITFEQARHWHAEQEADRKRQEARQQPAPTKPPAEPVRALTPLEQAIAERRDEAAPAPPQRIPVEPAEPMVAPAAPTGPTGAISALCSGAADPLGSAFAKLRAARDGASLTAPATLTPREATAVLAEFERLERFGELDDHDLTAPADNGDEELPGFLRRLAGCGAPR